VGRDFRQPAPARGCETAALNALSACQSNLEPEPPPGFREPHQCPVRS
jgi:hypothetical protein